MDNWLSSLTWVDFVAAAIIGGFIAWSVFVMIRSKLRLKKLEKKEQEVIKRGPVSYEQEIREAIPEEHKQQEDLDLP